MVFRRIWCHHFHVLSLPVCASLLLLLLLFQTLSGGAANASLCCYLKTDESRSDAMVLRCHRGIFEEYISRQKEFMVMQVRHMMTSSNGKKFRVTDSCPGNSPHKGQWRGALTLSLICVLTNGWVNSREAGDLRRRLCNGISRRRHCMGTLSSSLQPFVRETTGHWWIPLKEG